VRPPIPCGTEDRGATTNLLCQQETSGVSTLNILPASVTQGG